MEFFGISSLRRRDITVRESENGKTAVECFGISSLSRRDIAVRESESGKGKYNCSGILRNFLSEKEILQFERKVAESGEQCSSFDG
ncbi:MAG: hypothetical protein GY820_21270 [Gammaproteobacteria bacterium]|nr:hypothetical protein [Gammaproteobacteria bacterium]